MALSYTQISGTFDDGSGNPLSGTVQFTINTTLYASGVPILQPDVPVQAQIVSGSLRSASGGTLQLLDLASTGITFVGQTSFWFWTVAITVGGQALAPWSFFLNHSATAVDLYSLANTAAGGFTNPMTTAGDLIDGGASGAPQRLAIGSAGQVLTVSGGAPAWVSPSPALPLTTLGDTLYENATPAAARLPGNTTATKNFLTQTGTGSASAAPAWGTIAAGDVPTLNQNTTGTAGNVTGTVAIANGGTGQITQQAALDALAGAVTASEVLAGNGTHVTLRALAAADLPAATTSAQGAVILDGTAADIQPAGVQTAGAVGKAADSGHIHPWQPWQFLPETYGAKGDGQVFGDVSVSNTSAVITTTGLAAPSAPTLSNSGTGGSLTAGTYQAEVTLVNKYGETLASSAASIAISGTEPLTIRSPAGTLNATGWYAYVTQAGGATFTRQQAPGSPTALGTNLVLTANPTSSGANPPGANTSQSTFAAGDVGKWIMVHGANGATGTPLITTILSRQSATQVTLNAAATATVSGCPAVFGTDDTAAVAEAVAAAGAYGIANDWMGEVIFAAKTYILATGPTQLGDGANLPTFNTQIPIPYPASSGNSQKLHVLLTGAGDAGYTQYWGSTVPDVSGTALVSMLATGNSGNPTFGFQSVVGGPTGSAGFPADGGLVGFANVKVTVKGISIWLPILTNIRAWDFGYVSQMRLQEVSAHIFAPTGVNGGVQPYINQLLTNSTFLSNSSVGILSPVIGNNASVTADNCAVQGYECGFRVYDHFTAGLLQAINCDVAFNVDRGGGESHLISVANLDAEGYNGGIQGPNGGPTSHLNIWMSAECSTVVYDIIDNNGSLFGEVHFQDSADLSRGITVTGCANLRILNDELARGHMATPPAVPLTTAASTPVYRDAAVVIHTGVGVTVSAIAIGGTATGLTMAASSSLALPLVPSGNTVTLTYTGGTPTWDWWLT